jgi:poly(hydroxyalkanoate) depolymerase family esterase
MPVHERVHVGVQRALDLVRTGKLAEATATIQRNLLGRLSPHDARNTAESMPNAAEEVQRRRAQAALRCPAPVSADQRQPSAPSRATRTLEPIRGVERGAQFITDSYTNQAGSRSYKLYIPSAYSGQALPLVVMLHGCQQNPTDFAAGTGMNGAAESYPCFVVYPAQAHAANQSNCWNWFKPVDQQRGRGEPSLIAGITRQLMDTYCVDAQRVFAAGLSAGGAMAAVMGATYPDLYAAIGVHSGLPYGAAHDLPSALTAMSEGGAAPHHRRAVDFRLAGPRMGCAPTIVFHGDQDTKVHPRNGEQLIAQWTPHRGDGATNLEVTVQHGQVRNGHAYTREVYRDASGRGVLEHWRIHGAGHAWSGGSRSGSYTDPLGPAATHEMIRFFQEHHLPG